MKQNDNNIDTIQIIDERNRCIGVRFGYFNLHGQYDSHGYSYLGAREIIQSLEPDEPVGLESKINEVQEK